MATVVCVVGCLAVGAGTGGGGGILAFLKDGVRFSMVEVEGIGGGGGGGGASGGRDETGGTGGVTHGIRGSVLVRTSWLEKTGWGGSEISLPQMEAVPVAVSCMGLPCEV